MHSPPSCIFSHRMGAGSMDHRHMAQIIKRRTGGLSVSPHVVSHHTEASTYNQVYSRTTGIARFFPQSPGQTRMSMDVPGEGGFDRNVKSRANSTLAS